MMKIDITTAEYAAALWKANDGRNKRFEEAEKESRKALRREKMHLLSDMM